MSVAYLLFALTLRIWVAQGLLIRINDVFDEYSSNLSTTVKDHNMEPYKLPNVEQHLKDSWCQPEVTLTNGFLSGLSKFNRSGEILMNDNPSSMFVSGGLNYPELLIRYHYSAKCSWTSANGGVKVLLRDVKVKFFLTVETSGTEKVIGTKSKIVKIGSTEVDTSTSDSLIVNILAKNYSRETKEAILKVAEIAGPQIVGEAMSKLDGPLSELMEKIYKKIKQRKDYDIFKVKCDHENTRAQSNCYHTVGREH